MYKIIFFLLFSVSLYAHKNKRVSHDYGNVTVESSTSNYTESINKNLIIGQYASLLCKKLNFNRKILLHLSEGYNKFSISTYYSKDVPESNSGKDLNILIFIDDQNISKCLNIVEFSILNEKNLNVFSKEQVTQIYNSEPSKIIKEIIKEKIYRPNLVNELERFEEYNYFIENEKFHLFRKNVEIGIFDDILDFFILSTDIVVVFIRLNEAEIFESSSNYNSENKTSDLTFDCHKIKIENLNNTIYLPFKTKLFGEKIIIFENLFRDRVLLYSLNKKIFIQNLDEFISKE